MRVLQMLQMLQRFFALATHKGKFETEEDFADTIVPCYDLERMMGILSFDYGRCAWDLDGLHEGHVPLKHKKHGSGVKAPCLL